MAEEFLTLMADLDDESQHIMDDWYKELQAEGFSGEQTPGLPYHISLASFALDKEAEVVSEMNELAKQFSEIPVHISHIGLFAGGRILYAAPDMNPADLLGLRQAIKTENIDKYPWTPHATIMIDDAETIHKALPIMIEHFHPFVGKIIKLHLCAFWPTREIATVSLH
jgi:2'-5' RNA ligase